MAIATATWGFIQSLGFVSGVAIPSSIFETKFHSMLPSIADALVREQLRFGGAYEHASRAYVNSLQGDVQLQVIEVFVASLKLLWEVGSAFAILGFIASFFIQEVELRDRLETNYVYNEGRTKAESAVGPE